MIKHLNRLLQDGQSYGVVCHDAGGANQIISMHLEYGWAPSHLQMGGPAKMLWQEKFPDAYEFRSDFCWLDQVSLLITGTGWASDIEYLARKTAKQLCVPTVAVLDHWTNYRERFIRDGVEVLPDEIWVVDTYAEHLARQLFPSTSVVLVPDCYANKMLREVLPVAEETPNVLIYLLEPARSEWGRGVPGEFQALDFFLEQLPRLNLPAKTEVHLRAHPSEPVDKYAGFLAREGAFPVRMSSGSLVEGISGSRWAAGCQTYAMTLALRSGRKVFGTLPPWAPECVLPHQGIVHLRNW